MTSRVKYTFLVNGMTNRICAKNVLISMGPNCDPHRDVVVMRITYHPPIEKR